MRDALQSFFARVTFMNRAAVCCEIKLNHIGQFFFIIYY
jgi:hypothetical protein